MKETDAGIRLAAIQALAQRREPEVVPALLQALNDESINVQLTAISAIIARVPAYPEIVLQLPTDARHRIGRIAQERERNDIEQHLCDEAPV